MNKIRTLKSIVDETPPDELRAPGGDVKANAASNGYIEGWALQFNKRDVQGDIFASDGEYDVGRCGEFRLFVHHGLDKRYGKKAYGSVKLQRRAGGIWATGTIDTSTSLGTQLWADAKAGKLAFSSGSVNRLVERQAGPNGAALITSWPIVELSVSPSAVEMDNRVYAQDTKADPAPTPTITRTTAEQAERVARLRRFLDESKGNESMCDLGSKDVRDIAAVKAASFGFTGLGEFLAAVTSVSQERIGEYRSELKAAGLTEGTDGGSLVVPSVFDGIWRLATSMPWTPLFHVAKATVRTGSYQRRAWAETARADGSRRGGLTAYHVAETYQAPKSFPRTRWIDGHLSTLLVSIPVSNNLVDDAPDLLNTLAVDVGEELSFQFSRAIIRGNGVGEGLGIIDSDATVTVAKQGGQTADTIVVDNLLDLWEAIFVESKPRATWWGGPGVTKQLAKLALSGGAAARLIQFAPPGAPEGSPALTILGRPFYETEFCNPVGDRGDLILSDLSCMQLVTHAASPQFAASAHVMFLTNESMLRWKMRYDVSPLFFAQRTSLTGGFQQGPFAVLEARA